MMSFARSHPIPSLQASTKVFEQIYQAALQQDESALRSIKDQRHSLDIFDQINMFTPAGKLACEGHLSSASLLISLGANVDAAARGAAVGWQLDYAERLRVDHRANLDEIVIGAAYAGCHAYALNLYYQHGASMKCLMLGLAMAGDFELLSRLQLTYFIEAADLVMMASLGGHIEYAEKLGTEAGVEKYLLYAAAILGHVDRINRYAINHSTTPYLLAQGFARAGLIEQAEKYCIDYKLSIETILDAVIAGGHIEYAESLRIKENLPLQVFAHSAARYGHFDYLAYLMKLDSVDIFDVINAAVSGGYIAYAEKLCTQRRTVISDHICYTTTPKSDHFRFLEKLYSSEEDHQIDAIRAAAQQIFFSHYEHVLHALSMLRSNELRERIVQYAEYFNKKSGDEQSHKLTYSLTKLLRRAKQISAYMSRYDIDYGCAHVWSQLENRIWLLQGIQLVAEGKLTYDIFCEITSHLFPVMPDVQRAGQMQKLVAMQARDFAVHSSQFSIYSFFYRLHPERRKLQAELVKAGNRHSVMCIFHKMQESDKFLASEKDNIDRYQKKLEHYS